MKLFFPKVLFVGFLLAGAIVVGTWMFYAYTAWSYGGRWGRYAGGGSFIGCAPSMAPDGGQIIYASPRSGHGDIYVCSSDGSGTRKLTNDPNYEGDPEWSPDARRIVFVRESGGIGHIWIMNADGGNQVQLTSESPYDQGPSFSRDGLEIVFVRDLGSFGFQSEEIHVMNVDGSNQRRLTRNEFNDWQPCFSPTDDTILFSTDEVLFSGDEVPFSTDEVWLMDKGGENRRRLGPGSSPRFSPDGKRIVFMDDPVEDFRYNLYRPSDSNRGPLFGQQHVK